MSSVFLPIVVGQTFELMILSFFQAVPENDIFVKNGIATDIIVRHQYITAMSNYESKSIEVGFVIIVINHSILG